MATITAPSEPPSTPFERQQLEFDLRVIEALKDLGSR